MAVAPSGEYIVRKRFVADGVEVTPGSTVNVDGWANARKLVDIGYLRPVKPFDRPAPSAAKAPVKASNTRTAPAKKAPAKKAATKKESTDG